MIVFQSLEDPVLLFIQLSPKYTHLGLLLLLRGAALDLALAGLQWPER